MRTKISRAIHLTTRIFKRLKSDRQGVGAVEFAIIFPVLLALYISAFELTVGFSVYKRTTHAAGSVADLVSQQATVNEAYLQTMLQLSSAIFVPYSTDGIKLKVSGIQTDGSGAAKISWSWDELNGRPYAPNSPVIIPKTLRKPNSFFIHAELSVPHTLLMFMSSVSTTIKPITIAGDYYFAKRQDAAITCSDC